MTVSAETTAKSFILLPLASRRIAFAVESVIELTPPERLQNFPHKTPWIRGVIVRRNRVVPVVDTSSLFGEPDTVSNRFYLIVEWRTEDVRDWCAIPVQGECELLSGGQIPPLDPPGSRRQPCVCGVLPIKGEEVEVVDLSKLIQTQQELGESAS